MDILIPDLAIAERLARSGGEVRHAIGEENGHVSVTLRSALTG